MATCINCGNDLTDGGSPLAGICLECDGDTTGAGFGPLPPCHADSCSITWRDPRTTAPRGKIQADVNRHPSGAIECLNDTDGYGLSVRVYGTDQVKAFDPSCTRNWLHRDPTDNSLWVEDYPRFVRQCVEKAACTTVVVEGAKDSVDYGCTETICVEITNPSCVWPMSVSREFTLLGAELEGGAVTYEIVVDGTTIPVFSSFTAKPKVSHVAAEAVGHNVTNWWGVQTYSGTIDVGAVMLNPSQTLKVCVRPQVRRRKEDADDTSVSWGTYRLCLTGNSIVS